MALRPLGDNVLVQLDDPEKSQGPIVIPDNAVKEKPTQGVILGVGKLCKEAKVGMRVHLHGAGKLVKPKQGWFLCREEVIVAYEDGDESAATVAQAAQAAQVALAGAAAVTQKLPC